MNEYTGAPGLQQRVEQASRDDPTTRTLATPEENFQYADLVRRAMAFMADDRSADDKIKSPSENFLDTIRHENVPLHQSLGTAIGEMMVLITENARNQQHEYDPQVIQGALGEIVKLGYVLADAAGAIKEGPKSLADGGKETDMFGTVEEEAAENPLLSEQLANSNYLDEPSVIQGEDILDDLDYEFSQEEAEFLMDVEAEVAKFFGQHMLRTGQLDTDGYQQQAQDQVMKEYQDGALTGEEFPGIDPKTAERSLLESQQGGPRGS